MTATASAANQPQASALGANRAFVLRGILLAVVVAGFMSVGNVNIGAIGQGLGYALAGVTVFMTFRVLGFVDLTVDGAFRLAAPPAPFSSSTVTAPSSHADGLVAGALTGLATALSTSSSRSKACSPASSSSPPLIP